MYKRFYPRGKKVAIYSWLLFAITGVATGVCAWVLDQLVEHLMFWKWEMTQGVLTNSGTASAWFVFLFFSVLYAGIAALLTVYVGPGAAGSGIAELMGYFNGIKVPGLIGARTLIVKILGNAFGVSASLAIGKEGPLAHIGAVAGHVVTYLPFNFVKYF
mmetsp:Transcript_15680/g.24041  ORF Transcript_15680/g.24041 Transcript_15680/m.24041 type:complete len:159 (+) Transcript_15680:95-571(+)